MPGSERDLVVAPRRSQDAGVLLLVGAVPTLLDMDDRDLVCQHRRPFGDHPGAIGSRRTHDCDRGHRDPCQRAAVEGTEHEVVDRARQQHVQEDQGADQPPRWQVQGRHVGEGRGQRAALGGE